MRGKLQRFAEIEKRDNVIQKDKPLYESIKGHWLKEYFKNNNDIVVELACGRGEYTLGMSRLFPERNFIGVDLKGDRLWKGSSIAIEEGLSNTAFLRAEILNLADFFDRGEINELWITFPDPRPKERDIKRRLTSPRFLEIYKQVLHKGAWVKFKTDSSSLFEYTLETLKERNDVLDLEYTFDLYHSELKSECYDIRTHYEQKFSALGHDIKFLKFRFRE